MRKIKILALVLLAIIGIASLVSCGEKEKEVVYKTVTETVTVEVPVEKTVTVVKEVEKEFIDITKNHTPVNLILGDRYYKAYAVSCGKAEDKVILDKVITEALYKQYKFEDDPLELYVSDYRVSFLDHTSSTYDYYVKTFNVCDSYAEIEFICEAWLNESTLIDFYPVKLNLFGNLVSMLMVL